ncbi:MAG: RNA polymerase sigma factor [Acidimicrobiales bacterium]
MTTTTQFDDFVRLEGRRLQHSLVAAHGLAIGSDAAQAALVYCWEHWSRVSTMDNPCGYLYRVGQNAARREYRPVAASAIAEPVGQADFEPGLVSALRDLTEHQRVAVLLIHGHGYRLAEVASMLDVSVSTIRNHLRRGTEKLRQNLGVENEVA